MIGSEIHLEQGPGCVEPLLTQAFRIIADGELELDRLVALAEGQGVEEETCGAPPGHDEPPTLDECIQTLAALLP